MSKSIFESEESSPICCFVGHSDKKRLANYCVRGNSSSSATVDEDPHKACYVSVANIKERTKELYPNATLYVPGLVLIDDEESTQGLIIRSSCQIVVLVVDIMEGLTPKTIEESSLNLLKKSENKDFLVVLNNLDRLDGWKTCHDAPLAKAMKQQSRDVQILFKSRVIEIKGQFKEYDIKAQLYYDKDEDDEIHSNLIIASSALSGEGVPDLLLHLAYRGTFEFLKSLTRSDGVKIET